MIWNPENQKWEHTEFDLLEENIPITKKMRNCVWCASKVYGKQFCSIRCRMEYERSTQEIESCESI